VIHSEFEFSFYVHKTGYTFYMY